MAYNNIIKSVIFNLLFMKILQSTKFLFNLISDLFMQKLIKERIFL